MPYTGADPEFDREGCTRVGGIWSRESGPYRKAKGTLYFRTYAQISK